MVGSLGPCVSWDLVVRHCAALKAALALQATQVDALMAYAETQQAKEPPRAVIQIPATCKTYKGEDCARRSDEAALELGGMGNSPRAVMCRGCGETLPLG